MFRITGGKGFHIKFANGWTVSVQFGLYDYGDYYVGHPKNMAADPVLDIEKLKGQGVSFGARYSFGSILMWRKFDMLAGHRGSKVAKIAAWDKDGNWHNFTPESGYADIIKGYVGPDEVLAFMVKIAAL